MEKNKSQKFEDNIMNDIKSGRVKLRSKYIFLAEKLGLGSAFVLSVVLSILFFSLFLFYMKTADNLEYLSFGKYGFLAFLESFPYLLVVSFILFLFMAGYLITKSDVSYRKPFKYFAIALLFFIIISGTSFAFIGVVEKIEKEAYSSRPTGMFIKPFFKKGMKMRGRGVSGVVSEINDNYLIVKTPCGLQKISLEKIIFEKLQQFKKGDFVIAVGKRVEKDFLATKIRVVSEDEIPMIKRGIHRKFRQMK